MGDIRQVFFSYGHDKNRVVVEKLADDIRDEFKIEVWIDKDNLHKHDPWRMEIQNGIIDSDLFFSFASEHSVRNPGVCLDELRIAVNVKFALIQTILLEKKIDPPKNITELQMIDMSDWEDHYNKDSGQFDEEWYSQKLKDIYSVLTSPANLEYAKEIEFIKNTLNPYTEEHIRTKISEEPFYGRTWLYDEVNHWIKTTNERALWVIGKPGTGKSSFTARSFLYIPNILATIHCNDKAHVNTADSVFRLLIFKLCVSLHDYRGRVYSLLKQDKSILSSLDKMISILLLEPLSNLIDGGREPMVIMIDGLDELDIVDKNDLRTNPIAELFEGSNIFACIRPYFRFIITCRPQTVENFPGARTIIISQDDERNISDIRSFLIKELSEKASELSPEVFEERINRICSKAEGIFLYAKMVVDDIKNSRISLADVHELPSGLYGYYSKEFKKMFEADDRKIFEQIFLTPLMILSAFPEGLSPQILKNACRINTKWNRREESVFYQWFASFIIHTELNVRLFHKSISDWLSSRSAGLYRISEEDRRMGRRLAAKGCFQIIDDSTDIASAHELFLLSELLAEKEIWEGKSNRKEQEYMRLELSKNEEYLTVLTEKTHLAIAEYNFNLLQKCVTALKTILEPGSQKNIEEYSPAELNHLMTYWYAQGKLCEHDNKLSEAANWYKPIEQIDKEQIKKLDSEKVTLLWNSYAFCEYRLTEFKHSNELYQQLIDYLESTSKADSEAWLHAKIELIGVYRGNSQFDQALQAVSEMKKLHKDLLQRFPALWYKLLKYEAWTLKNNKRLTEARKVIEEAEEMRAMGTKPDPFDIAVMLLNYSYIFLSELDFENALEKIRQGCDICKEIHGADSLKIVEFYDRYGEIYQGMAVINEVNGSRDIAADHFRKAEEFFNKAYNIRVDNYHDKEIYMLFSLHNLISLYLYQNTHFEKIREWIEMELMIIRNTHSEISEKRREQEMGWIAREAVLFRAAQEVGYIEKSKEAYLASPSCLDDKLAGAGGDNYTKYGRDMHDVYPEVMDFPAPWCDAFVDWCFYKTFGEKRARKLLGDFDDYTVFSAEHFKKMGQWYEKPLLGVQIFFRNEKRICHTGLVYGLDRDHVYTIEGNTHESNESIEHGGAVTRKVYSRTDPCIEGYGGFEYKTVNLDEISVADEY